MQIKKNNIKTLIKQIMQVEKNNTSFFADTSILDYVDLRIKSKGFTIEFHKSLPIHVLQEVATIFDNLCKERNV